MYAYLYRLRNLEIQNYTPRQSDKLINHSYIDLVHLFDLFHHIYFGENAQLL